MADDRADFPAWGMPVEAQVAMQLAEARRLAHEGQFEAAVGAAEELLDHDPQDIEALLLVADVAPRYGHGEVGVLAARQALALGAQVGAIEAAALFAACEFDEALSASERCLLESPSNPRAHAIRGQVLEVLGRLDEADEALAEANRLLPDAYPLPLPIYDDALHALLTAAFGKMDSEPRREVERWNFAWRPAPDPATLASSHPPIPPTTIAVVSFQDDREPVCAIYTRNLARGCSDEEEIVDRLALALAQEASQIAP